MSMIDDFIATNDLDSRRKDGDDVDQRMEEAIEWRRQGAESEFSNESFDSSVYDIFDGEVGQNRKETVQLFRQAVGADHPDAANDPDGVHENGEGVERILEEAIKWYRRAAAEGLEGAKAALERLGEKL